MFKELGYKKTEYGVSEIAYSKEKDEDGYYIKSIWFHKKRKLVSLDGFYNMQELQAINEKCKELGWL